MSGPKISVPRTGARHLFNPTFVPKTICPAAFNAADLEAAIETATGKRGEAPETAVTPDKELE